MRIKAREDRDEVREMDIERIGTLSPAAGVPIISFAAIHDGIVYLCGVTANPAGPLGDVEQQTQEVLEQIDLLLRAAGTEGCSSSPVGYIEGWWVDPDLRRRGVGAQLVAAAEAWARSLGLTEMASDAQLANHVSHDAHEALGYDEVERLVCYRKRLQGAT